MGITLAILNAFGYIPECRIWFIINVKGMNSPFFRLFTIVLDKPSQPELLLLSKLFIMFKISSSVTILNYIIILVGDRNFFYCMFHEGSGQHECYWTNFLQFWKKGIKRIGNVYWLIYSFTILFKFTRKICLFAMSI